MVYVRVCMFIVCPQAIRGVRFLAERALLIRVKSSLSSTKPFVTAFSNIQLQYYIIRPGYNR
jgi:hypothetical protein